ncbi:hypothetical protein ElyMa_000649700 [Elysia marginata]|uniref:Uncharacterized protein n=1 Tax=Elysia marginata TaxID=1093978 RepID=A0AAV4GD72_9GAST|nr:hypothetical protein ElyMa_000649700 [Elysia marginata]
MQESNPGCRGLNAESLPLDHGVTLYGYLFSGRQLQFEKGRELWHQAQVIVDKLGGDASSLSRCRRIHQLLNVTDIGTNLKQKNSCKMS